MEAIISNLLNRFEKGALSRRELVQGLAMLTAASATPAQAQDAGSALKGVKIDHMRHSGHRSAPLPIRLLPTDIRPDDSERTRQAKRNRAPRRRQAAWSHLSTTRAPPGWWITSRSVSRSSTRMP